MIGVFGYRWIHRAMQVTIVITGISIVVMLIQALSYGSLAGKETSMSTPSAGLFLAGVALLVIDLLSWGPFVSDYTRYLPADTSGKRLFWAIYGGNVVSTILACTVGAYLTALLPDASSPVAAIAKVQVNGPWS